MNNLATYIIEKLHLNKETDSFDADEYNEKNVKDALNDIDLFLIRQKLDKDDTEIKMNSKGEVCVYIYSGDRDYFKELENKFYDFWNTHLKQKEWFSEIIRTTYGLRFRINYAIKPEDFEHKVFRHRK